MTATHETFITSVSAGNNQRLDGAKGAELLSHERIALVSATHATNNGIVFIAKDIFFLLVARFSPKNSFAQLQLRCEIHLCCE